MNHNLSTTSEAVGRDLRESEVKLGEWYWVRQYSDEPQWLGCATHIGSNYVLFEGIEPSFSVRVHFSDFYERVQRCKDPEGEIQKKVALHQRRVTDLMNKVNEIYRQLGMRKQGQLEDGEQREAEGQGTGLAVISSVIDIDSHKDELVKARDEDLPKLMDEIREANKLMAAWLSAQTLPLKATIGSMSGYKEEITDRVFNISLYAGLVEEVEQCSSGEAASASEKLRVMQRKLYMDEECLLDYRHGGMEFGDIFEFDKWLVKPCNRDRILPFDRCVVAMQVRRKRKDRESVSTLLDALVRIEVEKADRKTFLYIRNGENVYRLTTEIDFGEMIFPDESEYSPTNELYGRVFAGAARKEFITGRDYEERLKEYNQTKEKMEQWIVDNPDKHHMDCPYRTFGHSINDYEKVSPESIWYDDFMAILNDEHKRYNRIALILQGLFDRSEVLHPHPPIQIWKPEDFSAHIELVYDSSRALYGGEKPDFEAYVSRCNKLLNADSVTIGQERWWMMREAKKENDRMDRNWRETSKYRHTELAPPGNPGPGYLAKPMKYDQKQGFMTYSWTRERSMRSRWDVTGEVLDKVRVPIDGLFNVSAYRPGDYLSFFKDPRTREEYLQWAPMLIAAEEYHAGCREAKEPVKE